MVDSRTPPFVAGFLRLTIGPFVFSRTVSREGHIVAWRPVAYFASS